MTSPASVPGSRFDLLVPLTEGEAETVEVDVVTIVLVNEVVIGAEDERIEVVKMVVVNELELVLLGTLVVEDSDVLELDEVNDMSSTEDIENIGIA